MTAVAFGHTVEIPVSGTAAILKNNRIYVPVRFLSEGLGLRLTWEKQAQTVSITSK
ncbi:stalk domain-containing protein [Paenibacillus lacisoli]|uniref:stalk domain-containing protein n=1 Tax=Paenibacillus lacisoli TaxID=3064525 RepID=UPI00387E5FEC